VAVWVFVKMFITLSVNVVVVLSAVRDVPVNTLLEALSPVNGIYVASGIAVGSVTVTNVDALVEADQLCITISGLPLESNNFVQLPLALLPCWIIGLELNSLWIVDVYGDTNPWLIALHQTN
jgi:hypothetical protein